MSIAKHKLADLRGNAGRTPDVNVHLSYGFATSDQRGADLGNPLFGVLSAVLEAGSIRHAAAALGLSYRHVWGALKQWEETLGEPLIIWARGQRAKPTPFAERLVWAERSEHALENRLCPVLHKDSMLNHGT